MQDNFKQLTIGFTFSKDLKKVLLIHKKHPEWQKGKINAIGGKLKVGEKNKTGMIREFFEETGVKTSPVDWILMGKIIESSKTIYVFTTKYNGELTDTKTNTDEKIEWFDSNALPKNIISNLSWLVPLCKDRLEGNIINSFTARNKNI